MNYYYIKDGAVQGPNSLDELRALHRRGEIAADTPASAEGGKAWQPFSAVAIAGQATASTPLPGNKLAATPHPALSSQNTSTSPNYYYIKDGVVQGPSTLAQLRTLYGRGKIADDTPASAEGGKAWLPLSSIVLTGHVTTSPLTPTILASSPRRTSSSQNVSTFPIYMPAVVNPSPTKQQTGRANGDRLFGIITFVGFILLFIALLQGESVKSERYRVAGDRSAPTPVANTQMALLFSGFALLAPLAWRFKNRVGREMDELNAFNRKASANPDRCPTCDSTDFDTYSPSKPVVYTPLNASSILLGAAATAMADKIFHDERVCRICGSRWPAPHS